MLPQAESFLLTIEFLNNNGFQECRELTFPFTDPLPKWDFLHHGEKGLS